MKNDYLYSLKIRAASFKKTIILTLSISLAYILLPHHYVQAQQNAAETRELLQKLETEFKTNRNREEKLSTNISNLNKERKELNKLLITTADRIKKSEQALNRIEQQLAKLAVEERKIRKQIAKRHGRIADMLAVMQRMGRQPPPIMTTHRDDALKMVRTAMLLTSVFPQLKEKADKLTDDLTRLINVISQNRTKAEQLRFETENLSKKRKDLSGLMASKRSRILSQEKDLVSVRKTAAAYAKRAKNLKDLVARLDKEISKKVGLGTYEKELASGKAGLQSKINPQTGKNIELVPSGDNKQLASLINPARIKPAIAFEKAKGLLPLPASGKRLKSFGTPNKYGGKAKGITMLTRQNGQITSPSDGWIVYSGPFRSYGQLLIINAGGGYHILIAGMKKIDVVTGQFVLAGEPIATMGAAQVKSGQKPDNTNTKLYVEFRKDGKPIDPDPWWNKGNRKAQG